MRDDRELSGGSKDVGQSSRPVSKSVEAVESKLSSYLADLLHVDPKEIDRQKPFTYYGLASSEALMMTEELEKWLGQSLEPTLAWDYPTIAAVASFLGDKPGVDEMALDSESGSPAGGRDLSDMVSEIERLSEAEVQAALQETDCSE